MLFFFHHNLGSSYSVPFHISFLSPYSILFLLSFFFFSRPRCPLPMVSVAIQFNWMGMRTTSNEFIIRMCVRSFLRLTAISCETDRKQPKKNQFTHICRNIIMARILRSIPGRLYGLRWLGRIRRANRVTILPTCNEIISSYRNTHTHTRRSQNAHGKYYSYLRAYGMKPFGHCWFVIWNGSYQALPFKHSHTRTSRPSLVFCAGILCCKIGKYPQMNGNSHFQELN